MPPVCTSEWLGAMVTGRIVEYDPATQTYQLPPEHAASLTRAAGPYNLAVTAQFLPVIAAVEDRIVDSFRHGGGVPYAAYPRFQRVMAEQSRQTVAAALVDTVLPLVPGLVGRLQAGIDVLEVGCGCGHSLNVMACAFPNSRFTGADLSGEGIAAATAEAVRLGLTNARFIVQDAATLDAPAQYDLITAFDAIHDQAQPARVLDNIARALRPDGVFLMQDIRASSDVHQNLDQPLAPYLYTISCLHCMTVSLAVGGAGLGAMWGEEKARQMLAEAGFTKVDVKQLPHDIVNNYYIAQKG
jgi:2-polyprenyl-3-methyl-5-hydroxy-6-metoxy-1,4-benzoquinol methylase